MSKKIIPMKQPWKGTMSQRERFNAQMHYKTFDRTVNIEFGYWEENYREWDLFTENGITNEGEANLFFAFDTFGGIGGHYWLNPPFEHKVIREEGDMLIVQNGDGLTAEVPKTQHSTIPHYINSSVVTPDDWKRVKEERFRRDDPARKPPSPERLKEICPDTRDIPMGIGCGSFIGKIRDMLTFEGLIYACHDYPDMVEDMVETVTVLAEDYLDAVLPHVNLDYATGWEDICFKNGPIVSVDFFSQVIGPRIKRIGGRLKKHGIDIWYTDCDGDVRPILPVFLENGINCMFPYEVNSCTHPGELLDEYGGALRIMGGVDKMVLIAGKPEIKSYLESLEKYVARGGYIPFCDHRCPPDVTPENYLYYLDLKEKMFGMA
ncbi:MAG: hypothetical protein FWH24_06140 [Oscillospiraceae bacterium]|nr:hypothetical protein [Oscillospiraceae bacterium]